MTKGRNTTAQERIQIVKACIANGNDYGEIALKYIVIGPTESFTITP